MMKISAACSRNQLWSGVPNDSHPQHARVSIMPTRRLILFAALPATFASSAWAHSYSAGQIAIGHIWALPSETNETQVFVPFSNHGQEADALVAARSPICSIVELRENSRYDDPALTSI